MKYETEMDGCGRCMKYSLFFTNFIIFIGGIVVTGLAIWALVAKVPWIGELIGNNLLTGTVYVLLVCGIIVSVISFFGCIGASREVKCMLLTYFIVVFLLFVILLIGGVLGYVFREKVIDSLDREMQSSLRAYSDRQSVRDAWDATQSTLHCCGVRGWRDWSQKSLNLPSSCCRQISTGERMHCNDNFDSPIISNIYTDGCLEATKVFMQKHAAILGGAGLAVACLMFFGMIFSCALFKMIH